MKIIKFIGHLFCLVSLAILTQIGAVTYLLSLTIICLLKINKRIYRFFTQLGLYALFTFLIVPLVAPYFGRVPVTNNANLQPANYWLTVGLNRHYVVPELNAFLQKLSADVAKASPNATIHYLDANFPFINGYPLMPHFSHKDGRKIDFAYFYENEKGELVNATPTNSGYGFFENPRKGERDTYAFCIGEGYFQYDYPKYLTLGTSAPELTFSNSWNKILMKKILSYPEVQKVFIEPHLIKRLALKDNRLRFHGCRSVRHDDHIHLQI